MCTTITNTATVPNSHLSCAGLDLAEGKRVAAADGELPNVHGHHLATVWLDS